MVVERKSYFREGKNQSLYTMKMLTFISSTLDCSLSQQINTEEDLKIVIKKLWMSLNPK